MSVYVDELKTFPSVRGEAARYGMRWCHMVADSHDELMAFARTLGMKPQWLQHAGRVTEHFDLIPSKRATALRLGAIDVTWRELGLKMHGKTTPASPDQGDRS